MTTGIESSILWLDGDAPGPLSAKAKSRLYGGQILERKQPAVAPAATLGGSRVACLAHHGGVERRVRCLARRVGPQALPGHRADRFLGPHGLLRLGQDLRGASRAPTRLGFCLSRAFLRLALLNRGLLCSAPLVRGLHRGLRLLVVGDGGR